MKKDFACISLNMEEKVTRVVAWGIGEEFWEGTGEKLLTGEVIGEVLWYFDEDDGDSDNTPVDHKLNSFDRLQSTRQKILFMWRC